MRFRVTIDYWDRALLDLLAAAREVIIFDNVGAASSTGITPTTVRGVGDGAVPFIEALGLAEVDGLRWSMGGYGARIVALGRPALLRRLVLAGTGPGGVPDLPQPPEKVWQSAPKPVPDDEDYLYLFFPETEAGRTAGLASLRRLDYRLDRSHAKVWPDQVEAQITTLQGNKGLWDRDPELKEPVLGANGAPDVLIHATPANRQCPARSCADPSQFDRPPDSSTPRCRRRSPATTSTGGARSFGATPYWPSGGTGRCRRPGRSHHDQHRTDGRDLRHRERPPTRRVTAAGGGDSGVPS
jgi:pimeloyl-ACP methyl ester carboxylesterase